MIPANLPFPALPDTYLLSPSPGQHSSENSEAGISDIDLWTTDFHYKNSLRTLKSHIVWETGRPVLEATVKMHRETESRQKHNVTQP